MPNTIKKFIVGAKYSMNSICDSECVWEYEVVGRTAKMVTLVQLGQITRERFRVTEYGGTEVCSPTGKYSMSPTLRASNRMMAPHDEPIEAGDKVLVHEAEYEGVVQELVLDGKMANVRLDAGVICMCVSDLRKLA